MQDFLPKPLLTPSGHPGSQPQLWPGDRNKETFPSVYVHVLPLWRWTVWSLFWAQEWQALEKSRDKSDTLALGLVLTGSLVWGSEVMVRKLGFSMEP